MWNNYKNNDEYIIPTVYPEFTEINKDMIVMDYINGKTLYEINDDQKQNPQDADEFVFLLTKFGIKILPFDILEINTICSRKINSVMYS